MIVWLLWRKGNSAYVNDFHLGAPEFFQGECRFLKALRECALAVCGMRRYRMQLRNFPFQKFSGGDRFAGRERFGFPLILAEIDHSAIAHADFDFESYVFPAHKGI